jgi:hypothetical protein
MPEKRAILIYQPGTPEWHYHAFSTEPGSALTDNDLAELIGRQLATPAEYEDDLIGEVFNRVGNEVVRAAYAARLGQRLERNGKEYYVVEAKP